jgi:hypothetical protein
MAPYVLVIIALSSWGSPHGEYVNEPDLATCQQAKREFLEQIPRSSEKLLACVPGTAPAQVRNDR